MQNTEQAVYEVNIRVNIRKRVVPQGYYSGDSFSVDESLEVEAKDFMAVAKVLGEFHDLAEKLRSVEGS